MIPVDEFRLNQSLFPREELEKYEGQYVAWSEDGTRILASHTDMERLHQSLTDVGHDMRKILIDLVDFSSDGDLGGALFFMDDGAER